ncbi:MAG: SDR family oxidoreductase [Desulfatiglandales bacterium]
MMREPITNIRAKPVLVTGATGYVGGRLVPLLLESGYKVRVMGRSLEKLKCRPWASKPAVEFARADMFDRASLEESCRGCGAGYYLVHSMNSRKKDFAEADRKAALNMAGAASAAGLERIIYLGGLGEEGDLMSEHLRSRHEVAGLLGTAGVPVTFLRAAVILGSGSASFEMLRYLVDRLPVMTTPRWVDTPCQPIGIRNVLNYLAGCLGNQETTGKTLDIGGPDIVSYRKLMEIYAQEAGLKQRLIIPVPLLTPRLSSYWIHFVTPIPSSIARPLIEGLKTPVVCRENSIRKMIPQELLTCREAIRAALRRTEEHSVHTCWADAGEIFVPEWTQCGDADYAGGTVFESGYRVLLRARPEEVWPLIKGLGGDNGWYYGEVLWRLRGALDRLMGGVGFRGGRRDPSELYTGDALDFWRVMEVKENRLLRLVAEMKLPGEAILEFELTPIEENVLELRQLSRFLPRGFWGLLYWYVFYPWHQVLFKGMLKGMAKRKGSPIIKAPERFAPRLHHVCAMPPEK